MGNNDEKQDEHNPPRNSPDLPEPSNAWVWIILGLLAIIIIFIVFGGERLFGL